MQDLLHQSSWGG